MHPRGERGHGPRGTPHVNRPRKPGWHRDAEPILERVRADAGHGNILPCVAFLRLTGRAELADDPAVSL
jgi:hypothetical protein